MWMAAVLAVVGAATRWRDGRPAGSSVPPRPPGAGPAQFVVPLPDEERLAAIDLGESRFLPMAATSFMSPRAAAPRSCRCARLDSGQPAPLRGTLSAVTPFFSPDGRVDWRISPTESSRRLRWRVERRCRSCDAADGLGGSWSATAPSCSRPRPDRRLSASAASGGAPSRATELDVSRGEFSHRWPSVPARRQKHSSSASAPSVAGTRPRWSRKPSWRESDLRF